MLDKNLVMTDLSFESAEQAIRFGAQQMLQCGYVKEGYADAVVEREKEFPTGLPTQPCGVAIPHTNSSLANTNALCFMKLKKAVRFRQMGDDEAFVEARCIVLLAVAGGEGHMDLLAGLMELFSDEALLAEILRAATADEIAAILKKSGSLTTA